MAMPDAWSSEEVAATVADYLTMLDSELRGEPYSKAEHNRQLQALLNGRSRPSIEFKHANISAVMIELGLPYISGYKPRGNYQQLLRQEVELRFGAVAGLAQMVAQLVDQPQPDVMGVPPLDVLIVPPPVRERRDRVYERPHSVPVAPTRINYLEREARNASLGRAGELLVLEVEHRRLWEAGERALAERIDHVSDSRGDGLGYDILSFEQSGRERLIEVKTTRFGAFTPFFASSNEVKVSAEHADQYALYRVFEFRAKPRLFIVPGSLNEQFALDPVQYRASLT
jgi:hypothetical protein